MILTDNINFIKRYFPFTWEAIKESEGNLGEEHSVKVEQTKSGQETCAVQKEGAWYYIHSKYDPHAEAERLVNQQKDVDKFSHVFFYGTGLGYHIEAFAKKYPNIPISVYEPNIHILNQYLSCREIKGLAGKQLVNFYAQSNESQMNRNLNDFAEKIKDDVMVIIHPAYERIFVEQTQKFIAKFREVVHFRRASITAKVIFSKRLTINGLYNVPYLIKTPNILHEKPTAFKGKPAIIVAAGPSLDFEYENLKHIKDNGLAYIFSVGSSINSLIEKGIYPDAACTYDGSAMNQKVFEKVVNRGIDQIPLFFGSSVGFETIQNYPGPMYNFLVAGDNLANHYLKREDHQPLSFVEGAGSIAVIALQLLYRLECNPIILVGQNLAYLDERSYAGGIDYISNLSDRKNDNAILVKDVEGKEIYTSRILDLFKKQMESFIRKYKGLAVINTTKGGAHIEGTTFVSLSQVMEKMLAEKIVNNEWTDQESYKFDMGYFQQQASKAKDDYEKLEKIFSSFEQLFTEFTSSIKALNTREIEKCFNKFDKMFDKMRSNHFYLRFIMPMSYLQYENIMKMFSEVRFMTDSVAKAQRVINEFSTYLEGCRSDISIVIPLMEAMHQEVFSLQFSAV